MDTEQQIADSLMRRYQNKDMESRLGEEQFKMLFREAVKDYYPRLKEQYADQSVYGISFEIANVVQKIYYNVFHTVIYFNTEEQYQENIEDCEEDEKSYYRFEAWAEWDVIDAKSPLFDKLQEYLQRYSLKSCLDFADYENKLDEAAVAWYAEQELDFDDAFEDECEQIRLWIAKVLGELRREGFWEEQGNAGLYVLPFGGECDIDKEELVRTWHEMDLDYHGTEFLDYLDSFDV